ncbi:YGGT family protein [Pigmentiphaga humi]|uniref:YGGT family protein n=1 Tax=Pigmentiphaga humi TaxID=2478468 RepID=A0A3P4B0X9_9BURK|nr:YggT family protein [Pigmentiphaga humi]VCU69501.1 YGGT family protein [Pigmentiphaga humi]
MFGDIVPFLLNTLFTLYGAVLLLRLWLQFARMPAHNPISRTVFQVTDWIVIPLRRLLGGRGGVDWACLVAAWLTALVFLMAVMLVRGFNPLAIMPQGLWIALVMMLKWGINLMMWVTLLMVILSWVNPSAPAMPVLQGLTAPLLDPIRRVLPSMGGLDLSPLVLFLLTQVALMMLSRLGLPIFGL